jgi:hypothetical protein
MSNEIPSYIQFFLVNFTKSKTDFRRPFAPHPPKKPLQGQNVPSLSVLARMLTHRRNKLLFNKSAYLLIMDYYFKFETKCFCSFVEVIKRNTAGK